MLNTLSIPERLHVQKEKETTLGSQTSNTQQAKLQLASWDNSTHTIEELDDVGEVHIVVQDDVPVILHQGQGDEQHKVTGAHVFGRPDHLPH